MIRFLYEVEILVALGCKSAYMFLKRPQAYYLVIAMEWHAILSLWISSTTQDMGLVSPRSPFIAQGNQSVHGQCV